MSASNFASIVLPFTLKYEGGRVDDSRDPGGRTNLGITQKTFNAYLTKMGRPSRNVYTITTEEMQGIYFGSYWIPVHADSAQSGVDLVLFDYAVNSGPARARAAYGKCATSDAVATVKAICASRLSFLHALGTFKVFGRGWTARVAACEALGIKMAAHAKAGIAVDAPASPMATVVLTGEAANAKAVAAAHKIRGGGISAGGVTAGAATATPHSFDLPWQLLALVAIGLAAAAAFYFWRGQVQSARALALTAVAKGSA